MSPLSPARCGGILSSVNHPNSSYGYLRALVKFAFPNGWRKFVYYIKADLFENLKNSHSNRPSNLHDLRKQAAYLSLRGHRAPFL